MLSLPFTFLLTAHIKEVNLRRSILNLTRAHHPKSPESKLEEKTFPASGLKGKASPKFKLVNLGRWYDSTDRRR